MTNPMQEITNPEYAVASVKPKSRIKLVVLLVGLPGETIDMSPEGRITINGQLIEEPYLAPEWNVAAKARWNQVSDNFKHITPESYFVMGDNRDASNDNRSWGTVPRSLIYGKFMSRYWPLKPVD